MLMRVAQAKVNPLVARAVPVTLTQREKPSSEAVASPPTRRFFLASARTPIGKARIWLAKQTHLRRLAQPSGEELAPAHAPSNKVNA
ncbi:MAG: hypothetical protein ACXWU5_06235 [Rhodoplanes sp.]